MANQERRLGKGLGALLGEYMDEDESSGGAERQVRVEQISPNPFQPRSDFAAEALGELVESIRENGLLQPLVVRPAGDGWELVAGERRWRALRKLGWSRAPAIVRDLEDDQMLVLALVENLQRENLSPVEEALGYRQLMENFGLTQREVAERVGRDRSTISNTLRLLKLDEKVRQMIAAGRISAGHARALLGLEEAGAQRRLAHEVVEKDLSVRAVERRVRRMKREAEEGEEDGGDEPRGHPVARRAEQVLERALGTEVSVRLTGEERGRIGISFHDSEEFERLCDRLAGERAGDIFG